MGVYVISSGQEVLYIGSTNKFHIRFGVDLRHETTHTFINKLIKNEICKDRYAASDYLTNQCKYRIQVCKTKREAEALEHLAIWIFNPKYNKNI